MIRYDRRPGRLLTPHALQTLRHAALVAGGLLVLALLDGLAVYLNLGIYPWN